MLGPALDRMTEEVFKVVIDRLFGIALRSNLLEPAPGSLAGRTIVPEMISILAQAQRISGLAGVERTTAYLKTLAAIDPGVLDSADTASAFAEYAEATGASIMLRSPEEIAAIRDARAQAAQQRQAMEQVSQVAQGAKALASADMGGDNALARVAEAYLPHGAAP